MRSLRVALAALGTLGLAFTAACSSSSSGDTVHGIALVTCTDKLRIVQIVNPDNGKVLDTKYFSVGEKQKTLVNCGMPGYVQRSGFSDSFNELAAVQSFGSGWHIGTLEATDDPKKISKFKDLSGDSKGIGRPVTQSTGAFGPDGKLYVMEQNDGGTVVKNIDTSSGKSETLNIQLGWKEHDENGDLIDVKATTERSPYFLPNGKSLEVSPTPHTVYSPDGKWGFSAPDDAHLVRGDLQNLDGGKKAQINMPPALDGEGVDPVEPFVYTDKDHFIGRSFAGRAMYFVTFSREAATLKSLKLTGVTGNIVDPTPRPDNKAFALVDLSDSRKRTLHVATVDGTSVQTKKLSTQLPQSSNGQSARTSVLSWS